MTFQIKHCFTGAVMFECELPADVAGKSDSVQLGFAVKAAVSAGANLADASLAYADLAYADLARAILAGANLMHASLAYADLMHADLTRANLMYANLAHANLAYANLMHADLAYANLTRANGVIAIGAPDGWRAVAYLCPDGYMRIRVGCRDKSLTEGRAYWAGKVHRCEVMAALDYAEAIARLREWKIAP